MIGSAVSEARPGSTLEHVAPEPAESLRAGAPGELAIRADGLSCAFGSISALDDLSFEVPRGTLFGFLGPIGAGKTTTIRALLGLLEPDSGRAEVLGMDPRFEGAKIRDRSGALLGDTGLYDRLTAEDNLDFYACVWHLSHSERRARIRELLTRFGLWDRRKESPEMWSSGMRRKLAVARALLHQPVLVFLDEPTAGLDPLAAHELGDDLVRLASSNGVTVFLTTHDLAEAQRLCQQVAIIRSGQVLAARTPRNSARASAAAPLLSDVASMTACCASCASSRRSTRSSSIAIV